MRIRNAVLQKEWADVFRQLLGDPKVWHEKRDNVPFRLDGVRYLFPQPVISLLAPLQTIPGEHHDKMGSLLDLLEQSRGELTIAHVIHVQEGAEMAFLKLNLDQ